MTAKKKKRRKNRAAFPLICLLLSAGFFIVGFYSGRSSSPRAAVQTESPQQCTVTYLVDGEVYETESVAPGKKPAGVGYPRSGGHQVLQWLDGNGREAEVTELNVYSDVRYTAVTGPILKREPGYFPGTAEVFRPEAPLTRGDAARILAALLEDAGEGEAELHDVDAEDPLYPCASLMVTLGYMDAPGGNFSPSAAYNEEDFAALLAPFFRGDDIQRAMGAIEGYGNTGVTRAEAAVVLNALLGLEDDGRETYLPDVEPGYWAERAVALAAQGGGAKRSAGFCNIDGYLYSVQADGYALKNAYIGSLYFDNNGRYTSGSYELDDYVAAHIREYTTPDMTREEMLRAMYLHVRDDFAYLRRNYYQVSDIRWAMKEALTMYSTGKGNCYCYASAFWAAARGLGYDATTVSGTIGSERSPHGWVIIPIEGVHYVFDVEIEMAYHRDGQTHIDVFKKEHGQAVATWLYNEAYAYNQVVPREEEMGFALR